MLDNGGMHLPLRRVYRIWNEKVKKKLTMSTRRRVADPDPAGTAAGRTLTPMTQRVVRVLIAKSDVYLACQGVAELLGVQDQRRIYDILDILHAIGCVRKRERHYYRWRGRPTLGRLPEMPLPAREEMVTLAMTAQAVVRFFENTPSARRAVWKGQTLKGALQWKKRHRVLYDVLSVFRGIGLISPAPQSNRRGNRMSFVWSPERMLVLVMPTESELAAAAAMPDPTPVPPAPLQPTSTIQWVTEAGGVAATAVGEQDEDTLPATNLMMKMVTDPVLEFERLLGPVQMGDWLTKA